MTSALSPLLFHKALDYPMFLVDRSTPSLWAVSESLPSCADLPERLWLENCVLINVAALELNSFGRLTKTSFLAEAFNDVVGITGIAINEDQAAVVVAEFSASGNPAIEDVNELLGRKGF